ncbi:LuxR C-terminal-related transcriptional regulator [Ketobacter sp.]|uniref:LuxR C-terminal-related transcriptional regulator n=1 Tax=Ketobacter sp. TaxID=2083498 RepID=UPI000F2068CE|nr:LuxR C-terminal-related transcriptional regulator [Ketobacter sp.]RLT97009.1 MAG: hypothetical protein D9N14_13390 [Ketobacter sp.]
MNSTYKKTATAANDLPQHLPRQRLAAQVLASPHPVLWIGAPKGMGKSVLLEQLREQLVQQHGQHRVLLIRLTDGQGLDYVLRCLQEHLQQHGTPTRGDFSTPSLVDMVHRPGNPPTPNRLHLLMDGLDTRQHSALIHYLVESSRSQNGLLKLYLAVDDFIPLQNVPPTELYGSEQLHCLNLHDLRMTAAEVETLLLQRTGTCSPEKIQRLLQKSDGIPAVLTLLLDHATESSAVQCQHLSEWIEDNVLLYMEPMEVLRLASLSIMGHFNLQQASQLIGVAEDATLDWLLHYKPLLFRHSEDHQGAEQPHFVWSQLMQPFFFHCLLHRYRDLLPRILKRSEPWLTDRNVNPQCVEHVIRSIEKPWSQEILLSRCRIWYEKRNAAAIIRLVELIPEPHRLTAPSLALYYAWALILQKRIEDACRWLDRVEGQPADIDDNVFVLRALAAVGARPRPTYHARSALLEGCLDKNSLFQGEVLSQYTNMLHAVGASSLSKHALKKAMHFHRINQNPSHLSHAKCLLWRCDFNEGNTREVIEQVRADLQQMQPGNPATQPREQEPVQRHAIAMLQSTLADFLYESNHLTEAKALYLSAIPELINSEWEYESVVAQVGLTRLYISEGEIEPAQAEMERIKTRVRHRENTSLNAVLCFETMRILRRQGKSVLPAATEYELDMDHLSVESLFQHQHDKERLHWIKCYILVLLEQRNHTSALIYAVKGLIKSLNLMDNRYRTLFSCIKALCEFKLGQQDEASKSLNEAMSLAQQSRFLRTLINDDFGWCDLWQAVDQQQGFKAQIVPSFISEVRACLQTVGVNTETSLASQQQASTSLANYRKLGLTDKEYEILKLLAEGLCNKTIANRSEIALTTVKWHLQNIFGKLQAKNRTEAVVKAQEHALIGSSEG